MQSSHRHRRERQVKRPAQPNRLSRKTLWTVTLLVPVLLLALMELLLRFLNVGPDTALFERRVVNGSTYYMMNPSVKSRYFSRVEFSPATSLDAFAMPKPPGAFRIFCLGESTTVGFPYGYEGSFPRFLQQRLSGLFPERPIEVINLGMTATNSFTTLDIGRELFAYQPDLVIVYDGHNEFYGALGVASRESIARSRWIVELYLSLVRFRTFVALRDAFDWLSSKIQPSSDVDEGTMMERLALGKEVPRWSSDYRTALQSFQTNLTELAERSADHHVPVLFGTQVSNLRDLPPFVPGASADSDSLTRHTIDLKIARARDLLSANQFSDALAICDSALLLDSTRADAHYLLAQALDSLHRYAAAEDEYVSARDFDRLRFRTSTDFNAVIKGLSRIGEAGVTDIEAVFREHAPDSLIGRTLILEHLHPTARGAFLIASAYAESIRKKGLLTRESDWARRDTIADSKFWSKRTLTPLDVVAAQKRIGSLTSLWPFHEKITLHETPAETPRWLDAVADKMLDGQWTWERAHVEAAELYRSRGDLAAAKEEYRAISIEIPLSSSPLLRLGEICVAMKQYPQAADAFERSLTIEPTYAAARAAGSLHAIMNDFDGAMTLYQQAARLAATNSEINEVQQLIRTTEGHLRK